MFDLVGSLGEDRVTKDSKTITSFATDMSGATPRRANLVARPGTADHAREVLLIAGRFGLPVVPVVAKTNLSGLTIPEDGGVVLDLSDLKAIRRVDENELFMEIEAGVTWQDVHDYLAANHPRLRCAYSFSPPDSSVIASCLLDSVLSLSLVHGSASHWLNGLDIVLSNGDRVRTGIGAVAEVPCTSAPVPDLSALFTNTFGTLGVVTAASIQLWPNPAHRECRVLTFDDVPRAMEAMRALARAGDLCDDLSMATWPADAMLQGQDAAAQMGPDGGAPVASVFVALSGSRPSLVAARREGIDEIAAGFSPSETLDLGAYRERWPGAGALGELPARLSGLVDHDAGGLLWVSGVGPTARAAEAMHRGQETLVSAGFPPISFSRLSHGGHSAEVMYALRFDKKDFELKKTVTETHPKLLDTLVECGYFPCRVPGFALENYKDRFDPNFRKMFLNVRKLFDPGGIMNPGRWNLEGKFTRESVVLAKPRTERPDDSAPVFTPKKKGE